MAPLHCGAPMTEQAVIVGANSLIAPYLATRLHQAGVTTTLRGRTAPRHPLTGSPPWQPLELGVGAPAPLPVGATLYACLPIWLLPQLLPLAQGCRHLVAFSSTSVFSKSRSGDPAERQLAERLQQAEQTLAEEAARLGLSWTLLRPTLVYDGWRDRNVTTLAHLIRRLRLFPVAAPGQGLRQPLHADDLAAAALLAAHQPAARNQAWSVGGGEVLSYRQMVERIFQALALSPRIVPLPPPLLQAGFRLLRLLPRFAGYSPELFTRMNQDLVFDDGKARQALGWTPRQFHPKFKLAGEID